MKNSILAIIALFLLACSSSPDVIEPIPGDSAELDAEIYVVSHGWHTGIVVPARLIKSRLPALERRFKDTPYIEFGWGDKGFYQSNEITSGLTIRAIFWPTDTVIHAVAVHEKANAFFPNSQVEKLCLKGNEYSTLIRFIESSFYKNEQDSIVELKHGIYGDSQFYKSVGDYYLMNTCNKWTAKALKSAGMDIVPIFKLTAGSIMDYIVKNNQSLKSNKCSTNLK